VRAARLALALLAAVWLALLIASPQAAFGAPVSALVYALGSLVCHQRPERSFHLGLGQLPVCARCTGLYLGAAIGLCWGAVVFSGFAARPVGWRRSTVRRVLVAGALPTAITWVLEFAGFWSPSNATRFLAALPLGIAVALTVNYVEWARPPWKESRLPHTPI
jgi:uncharacterized membrane protein